MLTLTEIAECEGYYLDLETGDILRNVRPIPSSCRDSGSWKHVSYGAPPYKPRFERLSDDVTQPLEAIAQLAEQRLGRPSSGRMIHQQTALQPDGSLVTQWAEIF